MGRSHHSFFTDLASAMSGVGSAAPPPLLPPTPEKEENRLISIPVELFVPGFWCARV